MIKENNYVHPNATNYLEIMLYFNFLDLYSTAQTLTYDISNSTKMDMYHYKIDTTSDSGKIYDISENLPARISYIVALKLTCATHLYARSIFQPMTVQHKECLPNLILADQI